MIFLFYYWDFSGVWCFWGSGGRYFLGLSFGACGFLGIYGLFGARKHGDLLSGM
jgi:hypothetical protein